MSLSDMLMKTLLPILFMTSYCLAQSGLLNASRGIPQPNDPSGTTLYSTAIVNAAGNAATAQIGNTTVPVRIVIGGAGTTGNAVLASSGTLAPCTMDAAVTSGGNFFVIESTANPGQCHPQSPAPTAGTWVIGYLHDSSTTVGSTALVHVTGFIYGGSGGGGLPPGMSYTAPTLTLANSGTNGGTLALGGGTSGTSTIVAPASSGFTGNQFTFSSGINVPSNGLVTFASDIALGRAQAGFLRIGNSTSSLNENGMIGSANACPVSAPLNFSNGSPATICSRNMPLVTRSWIIRCVYMFVFTAGSGATTATFNITPSGAPSATSVFTSLLSGGGSPVYEPAVTIPATANTTTALTTMNTTLADGNTYVLRVDGVLNSNGQTLVLNASISNGTGQILSGSYCLFQ